MTAVLTKMKMFFSRFTDKKISAGIGVSTDDTVKIKKLPVNKTAKQKTSSYTAKYQIRDDLGGFELVNIITGRNGPRYRLRHIETGEQFSIDSHLFVKLFKKIRS